MRDEKWLPLHNYEGLYEVSTLGRVRLLGKDFINETGFHVVVKPKFLTLVIADTGYYRVFLRDYSGKRKTVKVHRLVAEHFIPNPENKPEVNHLNAVKTDNSVENLEWCTHQENITHAKKLNLMRNGERISWSKLTETDIHEIKRLRQCGMKMKSIANSFNVSVSSIEKIMSGINWGYLNAA